jgi:hypothetical protein
MNPLYKRHMKHWQYRQFKPCPACWTNRYGHPAGSRRAEPIPKPTHGWPFAVADATPAGYRIYCSKCGHTTELYPTGVGAVREWNCSRQQWLRAYAL